MANENYSEARTHPTRRQDFHFRSHFGPNCGADLIAVQNDGRHLASFVAMIEVNPYRKPSAKMRLHSRITKFILRVGWQELT
jgi:hypothetical protein